MKNNFKPFVPESQLLPDETVYAMKLPYKNYGRRQSYPFIELGSIILKEQSDFLSYGTANATNYIAGSIAYDIHLHWHEDNKRKKMEISEDTLRPFLSSYVCLRFLYLSQKYQKYFIYNCWNQ